MIYAHRRVRKAASDTLLDDDLLATVPQRRFDREVWVGAFAIGGIIAVLVALLTLTDASLFRGRYTISTQLTDAGGLRKGDPVQMRGVNVGRIQRFGMVPGGVAVRMELAGEYEVPADSRVVLRSNGILGGMVAELIPGRSPLSLENGDAIPGATSESDLFATAADVGTRADTVLQRAQELLSPRTVGALGNSATELQTLLAELHQLAAEQRTELAALSGSLRRSAGGVERAATGPELARALTRVDSLTVRLDATTLTLGRASNSLESVLGRLERGEGTLGRLSRDDSLYNNLNRAAANVNRLAEDIRENPKRYISVRVF
jgi:phospholipid/cholesterol/gamma-HCH transport system substrate-binding protein